MNKKLDDLAVKALEMFGTPETALARFVKTIKAQKGLLDALALDYLIMVNEEKGPFKIPEPAGAGGVDVGAHKRGRPGQGQGGKDQERAAAAAVAAAAARKQAEKDAQRAENKVMDEVFNLMINNRAFGTYRFGELSALEHDLNLDAANKQMEVHTLSRNAILVRLVREHCGEVQDMLAPIHTLVNVATMKRLQKQADREFASHINAVKRMADVGPQEFAS